jgi:hypothetical protein
LPSRTTRGEDDVPDFTSHSHTSATGRKEAQMFGSSKKDQTPHRSIRVETTDSEEDYDFIEGGREVSFRFEKDLLIVTKSEGLNVHFPILNVIRVEEYFE